MDKKNHIVKFIWSITYAHVIAYFLAGLFALVVVNYKELYSTESLSMIMRPTTDPVVALGPALQIVRGAMLALAIYPIRKAFFDEKRGYLKLGLAVLVLSLLSTIGPTMGSFDGYIYTKIPAVYQILGYPEAFVYVFLFVGILYLSRKLAGKKSAMVISIVLVGLILLMGIMGFLFA